MERNKFEISVTFLEILQISIIKYNFLKGTDFKIDEVIDDEITFCIISVSDFSPQDIYNLGYLELQMLFEMRKKGEIGDF